MHAPVLEITEVCCGSVPLETPHVPDHAPIVAVCFPGVALSSARLCGTEPLPDTAISYMILRVYGGECDFLDRSTSCPHSLTFCMLGCKLLLAECWGPIHQKPRFS